MFYIIWALYGATYLHSWEKKKGNEKMFNAGERSLQMTELVSSKILGGMQNCNVSYFTCSLQGLIGIMGNKSFFSVVLVCFLLKQWKSLIFQWLRRMWNLKKKKKEENESVRYLGVVRLCLKLWMILRFLPFFYCLRCQKCHKYQVKVEKKYELIIYIHLKGAWGNSTGFDRS